MKLTKPQKPGIISALVPKTGIVVSTGDQLILVTEAQLESKSRVSGQSLIQQLGISYEDQFK